MAMALKGTDQGDSLLVFQVWVARGSIFFFKVGTPQFDFPHFFHRVGTSQSEFPGIFSVVFSNWDARTFFLGSHWDVPIGTCRQTGITYDGILAYLLGILAHLLWRPSIFTWRPLATLSHSGKMETYPEGKIPRLGW